MRNLLPVSLPIKSKIIAINYFMQIVRFADLAYYSDEMLSLYWLNEYGKMEAEVTCKATDV